MNTRNYQNAVAEIIQQAQREIMYKAIDVIEERNNRIRELLEKGRPILEQTQGERFERLYNQRKLLWMKIDENRKSIANIWDTIEKFCTKIN